MNRDEARIAACDAIVAYLELIPVANKSRREDIRRSYDIIVMEDT